MKKLTFLLLILTVFTFTGCRATEELTEPENTTAADENTASSATSSKDDSLMDDIEDTVDDIVKPDSEDKNSDKEQASITEDKAKEHALSHAGLKKEEVTFTKSSLDREDGRRIYSIEFYDKDNKEYDYEIDALTGEILSYDHEIEHEKAS